MSRTEYALFPKSIWHVGIYTILYGSHFIYISYFIMWYNIHFHVCNKY